MVVMSADRDISVALNNSAELLANGTTIPYNDAYVYIKAEPGILFYFY